MKTEAFNQLLSILIVYLIIVAVVCGPKITKRWQWLSFLWAFPLAIAIIKIASIWITF